MTATRNETGEGAGAGAESLEGLVARFEAMCWAGGAWPEIDDFLPAEEADRAAALVELIHADLEFRLKAGRPACLADYLDRYPELAADAGALRSLLATEREFRQRYALAAPSVPAAGDGPGRLGRFERVEEVARGGFGVVYRAVDPELDRVVALKTPRTELVPTEAEAERFLREARHAARLRHPGIVTVHETGRADGRLYIVCEYIEGTDLAALAAAGPLAPKRAAELVAQVAEALDYAHRQGVIHRDIKPSNILIDSEGRPRLADFGLARRVDGDAALTADGQVLGTPAYMAPEQARGDARGVDARTDVYGLGAVLYELLTGSPPFRGYSRIIVYQVLHDEPRPPRRLNDRIPRGLEAICLKAMAREPARRYPSAAALADDLGRFLRGEPVRARPVGWPVRLWRRARRRPLVAALVGALVLAVAVGFAGVSWQWGRAVAARHDAERSLYFHRIALAEHELAAHDSGRASGLLDECPPRLRGWEWYYLRRQLHDGSPSRSLHGHTARIFGLAYSPDGRRLASGDEDQTVKIWDAATGRELHSLRGHTNAVLRVTFSPDGRQLATTARDGTVRVWDADTGRAVRVLHGPHELIWNAAYSPDGRHLAAASGDGTVIRWDAASGRMLRTLQGHSDRVTCVVYSPDGRCLVSTSDDGTARVWDAATGRPLLVIREPITYPFVRAAYSPDGRRLALADRTGALTLRDARTGELLRSFRGHADIIWSLAFHPDGTRLASASNDRSIKLWDVETGQEVLSLRGHGDDIRCLAFSPDGHRLASSSWDRTIRIWDATPLDPAESGEANILRGHDRHVRDVAYSPDGRHLASASDDGTVRVWDLGTGGITRTLRGHTSGVLAVAFHPDGRQLASAGWDHTVMLWDAATGRLLRRLEGHTSNVFDLAYSPDGRQIASSSWDRTVRIWDPDTGRVLQTLGGHRDYLYVLAYDPSGRSLAVAGGDKTVRIWDAATGRLARTLRGHRALVRSVAYSPDGRRLASVAGDGSLRIWDVASGKAVHCLRGHEDRATSVSYSPDGRWIASAGWDRILRIWDATTGREAASLSGCATTLFCISYSPDGRRLASAGADGAIRLWDAIPPFSGLSVQTTPTIVQ